jgi:hypothetical protein
MELITDRATARNSDSPSPTAAADIGHDREWWARQSLIDRTDWQSIGEAAAALLATVGLQLAPIDNWDPTDFRRLCDEADRRRRRMPQVVWSVAGRCINRLPPRKALKTFLSWCDQHDVARADAMSVFEAIIDKELAK